MLPFIFTAVIFIAYLEILGQWLLHKLNKNIYPFAFGVGFLFLMAYGYLFTSFMSASRLSFYLIYAVYAVFLAASGFVIVKDFKKVKWNFKWQYWLILLVCTVALSYYSYNTTLGELNGFDTVFYLNMISTNIGLDKLNTRDFITGTRAGYYSFYYTFQSYYYFISCFVFTFRKILSLVGIRTYYTQLIIWPFQFLFHAFYVSVILNTFDRFTKDKKILNGVLLFLFVFYLGRQYFNSVFGFFGNTMRQPAVAYCSFFLYEYFNESNKGNKILFFLCLIGMCSFSSSNMLIALLFIFGSFFFMADKEDDLFRWYAVTLLVPLATLHSIYRKYYELMDLKIPVIVIIVLFLLNGILTKAIRLKHAKKVIFGVMFLAMLVLSYMTIGALFHQSTFAWTNAEIGDMTINYFALGYGSHERIIYCYTVWILLIPTLIFCRRDKMVILAWIMILCFFNPMCCSFLHKIDRSYQRAYDIIANPFTLTLFAYMLFKKLNNKYVYYGLSAAALLFLVLGTDIRYPVYYNEEMFKPGDDYNKVYKMKTAEYDIIEHIYDDYRYRGIERPFIVTPNLLTMSSIPEGEYMYGRELLNLYGNEGPYYQVYATFYPYTYFYNNGYRPDDADYQNIKKYIDEIGVDYLVIDSNIMFHYRETDEYYTLMYLGESISYDKYEAWPFFLFYTGE